MFDSSIGKACLASAITFSGGRGRNGVVSRDEAHIADAFVGALGKESGGSRQGFPGFG
jgi:hypothetical protein